MPEKTWIKAALLTAAAIGLATPALAQPGERGERGRGERMSQGRTDAPRGDFRMRGDDSRPRAAPGISRTAPAPAPRAAPAPRDRPNAAPTQRAAPPVTAAPTQRTREPRPGTREWYQQRGVEAPRAQPDPATARPRSSTRMERERPDDRNRPNWQNNQGRDNNDRRVNDGRNWNGRDRDRDGRDWNRERNWNDNRWNRNDWRYVPGPRVQNRWDGFDRWDNGWRRDRRYDWQQWRRSNRDVFHLPYYRAPFGWTRGYSRFSIGIYLDNILFSTSYWIDDPYRFRLPPAYGPFRWIRYYDDALLVDLRDGYVVDVVHDVFW